MLGDFHLQLRTEMEITLQTRIILVILIRIAIEATELITKQEHIIYSQDIIFLDGTDS